MGAVPSGFGGTVKAPLPEEHRISVLDQYAKLLTAQSRIDSVTNTLECPRVTRMRS